MGTAAKSSRGSSFAIERSTLSTSRLGFGVLIAWLVSFAAIHGLAYVIVGPAEVPFGPARFAWTVVVNGVLLGLLVAGHAHLYRNVASDLEKLRPILPESNETVPERAEQIARAPLVMRRIASLIGIAGGLAIATLDPALRGLNDHYHAADPRYLIFLVQNMLFGALIGRIVVAEIHMTRGYARLGERVEVDLLDLSRLLVFAQKGLRSVVVWVLISTAFSMFWVLDSAGESNILLPIAILALTAAALVAPTLGVHRSIVAAKHAELAIVSEAIHAERQRTLSPRSPDGPAEDARLGNLIQYEGFVRSIREWPFDSSIVARSALLVVLGTGSWLGGAIVERLLGALLD